MFHTIVGLIAIIDDEFFVSTRNYVLQFDTTQLGVDPPHPRERRRGLRGLLANRFGVRLHDRRDHGDSSVRSSGFAWLPYAPVWGVVFIAIAVSVIWVLTLHGRDVVSDYE